jgi:hypothetical protein
MSTKTVCTHCNKSYVNVLEHITKTHSWIRLVIDKDGNLNDEDQNVGHQLFWKNMLFDCDDVSSNTDLWFCNNEFEGSVFVSLKNNGSLVVDNIQTIKERRNKRIEKNYTNQKIEVRQSLRV